MKTRTGFGVGLTAVVGASALFLGLTGATPVRADAWDGYGRNHVYIDIADVRRDERLLRDLEAQHDEARRCHDWNRMHSLDRRIAELRRHINDDRRDIRVEVRRDRISADVHYRDGDYRVSGRYRTDDRNRDDRGRYRDDGDNGRYRRNGDRY